MDQTKAVKLAKWVGKKGGADDACAALDVRVLADRLAFCTPPSPRFGYIRSLPSSTGREGGKPPRRELCMDPLSWQRLVETRVSYHYERRAKNEEATKCIELTLKIYTVSKENVQY